MPDYFDEHNCEPLEDGDSPNHMLHFARLLIDGGWSAELQMEFGQLFPNISQAPPASKEVVKNLPRYEPKNSERQCTICLGMLQTGKDALQLPCKHIFHPTCIVPWLEKTNSCPVCRYELPTDDPDYEEHKKQVKRQAEREKDLEELHDSMFS